MTLYIQINLFYKYLTNTYPMPQIRLIVGDTRECPTLSDPMDCSLPGSSAHGIFQARILEWVAIAFLPPNAGPN